MLALGRMHALGGCPMRPRSPTGRPRSSFTALLAAAIGGCSGTGATDANGPASTQDDAGHGGVDSSAALGAGGDVGADVSPPDASGRRDSATTAPPMRGPVPPSNGTAFPFPQNRESARCTYPTGYDNAAVQAAYDQWKSDTVTSSGAGGYLRVRRPHEPGLATDSTVSEGIGYGMLIAVYMNDQSLFDNLWRYEQHWVDAAGLMNWYVLADGSGLGPNGSGGATDADEDMAFALAMADRQWGGQGSIDKPYRQYATQQIANIWNSEIQDSKLPKPGEWGGWNTVNISYFAPAYYRVFSTMDTAHPWANIIKTVYDTIDYAVNSANGNQNNGLVPAWCDDSHGSPCTPIDMNIPNDVGYQYDSCRTPFRIGVDWCWNGEARAQKYVALTSSFFAAIGATNIADTYSLDGTPRPQHPGGHSAAFVGPAGVGAMSAPQYLQLLNDAYGGVATLTYLVGGTYYDDSWTVMSLLMMTGSLLDYTAY
jgi:endo-1,4-beta-D-glucanase Y